MQRMEFRMEGSQGDEHSVAFEFVGGNARAMCTCRAGASGQFCKHRVALLRGNGLRLLSDNANDLVQLDARMKGTDLERAYDDVLSAIRAKAEAERVIVAAKRRLAKVAHNRMNPFPLGTEGATVELARG